MKIQIKAKDFHNKPTLAANLDMLLKKPLMALKSKKVESLPFCYEVDYFGPDKGFISIGVTKEVQKLFKTKRVKGQGVDSTGKAVKIDKKKVAYGYLRVVDEGNFEFCIQDGIMKPMQVKKVIKSIQILKKHIGDNFSILFADEVEMNAKISDEKTKISDSEKSISEELESEKAGRKLFGTSTFGHLKKKVALLKQEKDKSKRNVLKGEIIKLGNKWLEKHGDSTNKEDKAKKSTIQKLITNLQSQVDMTEGSELVLYQKKIVRDWNLFVNDDTGSSENAFKMLNHVKQIQSDVLQWKRLYGRFPSTSNEEKNAQKKLDVLVKKVQLKVKAYADLYEAQLAIQEFKSIKSKSDHLINDDLPATGAEGNEVYKKIRAIDDLSKQVDTLIKKLN